MKNFNVAVISELTGRLLKTFENLTEDEAKEMVKLNSNDFESWVVIRPYNIFGDEDYVRDEICTY